jgi:hypothetical protein
MAEQHNYHEREGDLITSGTISNKSTEAQPQLKRGFNDNFVAMKICTILTGRKGKGDDPSETNYKDSLVDVYEEQMASIFRTEEQAKHKAGRKLRSLRTTRSYNKKTRPLRSPVLLAACFCWYFAWINLRP